MILESNWKSNGLEIRWNTDGILPRTRQYHKWNLDGKLMESSGNPNIIQIYDYFGQII